MRNTLLSVAAPGLLGNDTDIDSALAVQAASVAGPANGSLSLHGRRIVHVHAVPGVLRHRQLRVPRRRRGRPDRHRDRDAPDRPGRHIRGPVYYFGDSGGSASNWDLVSSPPAASDPEADVDSDGNPGLEIKDTNEGLGETDPDKFQTWSYAAGSGGLVLDGPVALRLWSTGKEFDDDEALRLYVWLRTAPGASCTTIASTDVYDEEWNGGVEDWVYDEISLGTLSHTIDPVASCGSGSRSTTTTCRVALSAGRPSRSKSPWRRPNRTRSVPAVALCRA